MANPQFPGNISDLPENPLYPGYYAGKPLPRDIKKFRPPELAEYDFDTFSAFIDDYTNSITGLPNWVAERVKADIKRAYNVTATPRKQSLDTQRALETGELDETPGVSLALNLNPADWIEDPGKQLSITAKKWRDAIINRSDWEDYVNYRNIWTPLIYGRSVDSGLGPVDQITNEAFSPFQLHNLPELPGTKNPTSTENSIFSNGELITTKVSAYEKVGSSFLDFATDPDSLSSRKGNYNALLHESVSAAKKDVENALGENMDPRVRADYEYFVAKQEIAGNMKSLRGKPTTTVSLSGASAELNRFFLEGDKAQRKTDAGVRVGIGIDDILNSLYNESGDPNKRGAINKAINDYNAQFARLESEVEKLKNVYHNQEAAARLADNIERLKIETGSYRGYLQDLENLAVQTRKAVSAGMPIEAQRLVATNLRGQLELKKKKLSGDYFDGIEDQFIRVFATREVFGPRIEAPYSKEFHPLVNVINAAEGKLSLGYRNTDRVLRTANRLFEVNEAKDLSNLISGDFMDNFVWDRIRTRFDNLTPAKFVRDQLEGKHFFGLVYDKERSSRNKRASKTGEDIWANLAPKHSFTVSVLGQKRKIEGGEHLEGAIVMHKTMGAGKLKGALFNSKKTEMIGMDHAGMAQAIAFLNNPRDNALKVEMVTLTFRAGLKEEVKKELLKLELEKIDKFKKYLLDKKLLNFDNGNIIDSLENRTALYQILQQLGKIEGNQNLISILTDRAGWLQHVSSYANQIQDAIVKSLSKILGPYFALRKAVVEVLSELLAKLTSSALAAITAGFGLAIAPVVDRIIKYTMRVVVGKLVNTSESFMAHLLKADISGFIENMEKDLQKMTRNLMFILAVPLFMFMLVIFFAGGFISSTPTSNPGRAGGGGGSPGGGGPQGEVNFDPIDPNLIAGCPLTGNLRYGPGSLNGNRGHGSNTYWGIPSLANNVCSFTIPYIAETRFGGTCPGAGGDACGPTASVNSSNICHIRGASPQWNYYGFAMDVSSNNYRVYLPKLGNVTQWNIDEPFAIFKGTRGWGVFISGSDESHEYKLYLGHLTGFLRGNSGQPKTGAPGDPFATLFTGGSFGPHVHIEVLLDTVPRKPEDLGICL